MRKLWKGLLAGGVIGTAIAAVWMRNNRNRKGGSLAAVKRAGRQTVESMQRLRRKPIRFRMVARAGNRAIDTGRDAYDWAKKFVKKMR
ncbi:MAG: hypothetical protein ACM3TT_00810 [Syntrophothermus sp.]